MTYSWLDRRSKEGGDTKLAQREKPPAKPVRLETRKDVERKARKLAKDFTIVPSADNVIVKRLEAKMTESGLVLVKTEQKFIPSNLGILMAVGPGKTEGGVFVPTHLKVGDLVWFHLFPSGCEVTEERNPDETYIIIAEKQCVGVVSRRA